MNYHFKTKPFKHQVNALRRFWHEDHMGLLWEPGTGKTKCVIDWTCMLHAADRASRVMVVCPLSVTGVWEDEYALHAPIPYVLHTLDKSDSEVDWRSTTTALRVLVVNYDLAWRREEIIGYFNPDVVVADESHRIKKPSARRSRYLRRFNKAPYRAILTGTPAPKSYLDIYSQWVFLNPERFGTRVNDFKDEYIRYGGFRNFQIQGYRNIEQLKAGIDADAMTLKKEDCLDLPPRTYSRVPVMLEDGAWEAYKTMANELYLELMNGEVSDAKNVGVKIMRLHQITGGWINSDEGNVHQISTAKIDATRDLLEDLFDADERVVIFARFRAEVGAIADLGARFKVPTYVLSGATRRTDRDDFRRDFQAKAGPSLFVSQIQTGSLGITLHSSHEVIFYSVTYALDDYIQACDRVHRSGQQYKVTYRHLVARGTVDLDLYANLKAKKQMMDMVMANPKSFAKMLRRRIDAVDKER